MESLQPIVVEEIEQKTIEGTVEPYSAPLASPNNVKNRYEIEKCKEWNPVFDIFGGESKGSQEG